MKKSYSIAFIILIVAILWIASGVVMPSGKENAETTQSEEKAETLKVRVKDLQAEKFTNDVSVTGRTEADRTIDIKAETTGQITEILFEKGQKVEEGDIIAKLDVRDRKARVNEASQRVKQRQIQYDAAKSLENQGFNSKIRLAESRADLETARAQLKQAQIDLENIEVKAPFTGFIYQQNVELGDFVAVGENLFSLVDLNPLQVVGFVTEKQIGRIRNTKKATAIFVDKQERDGTLSYVAPAADPQTRTFQIEVTVPNENYELVEGMTTQIRIPANQVKAHKISPAVLTLNDEGAVGVKTVNDSNVVSFVPVEILASFPDHVWIGGLPETARIITVGQEFVISGEKVEPVTSTGDGLL